MILRGESSKALVPNDPSYDRVDWEAMAALSKKPNFPSKKPATAKQLKYLSALGWVGDNPLTQSEASKLITGIKNGSIKVEKHSPMVPSDKQINYLNKLGYKGVIPGTKDEASKLIDMLKDSNKGSKKSGWDEVF